MRQHHELNNISLRTLKVCPLSVKKMIIYPNIGSLGRLGNQMFQLASMKALSFESGMPAILPLDLVYRQSEEQYCLLDYFQHNCEKKDMSYFENKPILIHKFPANEDTEVNREDYLNLRAPIIFLEGYPESELFFKKYKEKIKQCFEIVPDREDIIEFAKEYINELKEKTKREIVAIHIRRGDLTNLLNETQWKKYPEYIKQFIDSDFSEDKYHFLFFCGGSITVTCDNTGDISWCKKAFHDWKNITFCDVNNTIRELEIMKNCDHMILTNRSTFSWWGAYLIKNPNKKVVVPRVPYGSQTISMPEIYWASEFKQIDVKHPE